MNEVMNIVKFTYDGRDYLDNDSSTLKMCILGRFLSSDVRERIATFKEWALEEGDQSGSSNITSLDKTDNIISLKDLYSEEETPTELQMSLAQFIQLLDEWDEKVCKTRPHQVLIKHENDQFIIEVSD